MKKILALMLAVLLVLSLAACGEKENKPSGSNTDKPGTSQTDNQGGESTGGDETDEPNATPTMEQLALKACLPGLTALEGCTFEEYWGSGVKFDRNDSLTADDMKTLVEAVWTICADVSADGVYTVNNSGSTNTIKESYASLADKYGEDIKYVAREEDDGFIAFMDFEWYYTYEGQVRVVQIGGTNKGINVKTMNMGTLEK